MLKIVLPERELWDEQKEEFIEFKEYNLTLEHSLVSLSKWESRWHKPFLSTENISREESIDYIRCMTITQNIPDEVYQYIPDYIIEQVEKYISSPMTATYIYEDKTVNVINREPVTSELIYYWMITLNIPMECQKWHLNRLITLIKVCNKKSQPRKKTSRRELASKYASINAARRKKYNTKG